jgi:import inner membrane translocase subunit TIM16
MTLDEAHLILNVKRGEEVEMILKVCPNYSPVYHFIPTLSAQNYEHLFKANSPAPPPPKTDSPPSGRLIPPSHSHYLQSKVVRARERIEAELKIAENPSETGQPPPPPEAPGGGAS